MPRLLLPLASGLAVAAAWVWLTSAPAAPGPRDTPANRPVQQLDGGYASSDTCRACHPSQYATWRASYHRTMTQVASSESVRADFAGVQVDAVHGRPMRLGRDGPRFFAEFDDPDGQGAPDASPRISREVVMITGSHHQQIYWYATGRDRLLGQLPGAYLIAEQRWIPRRAAVLHPPDDPVFSETGHWNAVCIACHTTSGKPEFDTPFGSAPIETQRVQTRVAEFGIACEACHGPSAAHVSANRNPLRRYRQHLLGAGDPTTTLPTQFAARVSSQVCGQCHGVWEFADPADERVANTRGLPYRPGAELSATRFVAQPTKNADAPAMRALLADDPNFIRDSFWPDGMVRVSGREYNGLIESPCYSHATDEARTLSCFSCHTMHKASDDPKPLAEWANDQLGAGMDGNQACTNCHTGLAAASGLTAHSRHEAGSSGSSCYNCHMPYTTYGLLKTIRSHTVSSPSLAESVESGRPNACALCHLDKTVQWTADALLARPGSADATSATAARRPLTESEQRVSAAVLWALTGDAGQRAIVAQAMGWRPAQEASGTAWMPPFLAQLLDDPYDAVRFIASRSLKSIPGFAPLDYDFAAPQPLRYAAQLTTMRMWDRERGGIRLTQPALLFDPRGSLQVDEMLRLLKTRNNRPVLLRE